jgi:hypothetical protein
MPVCRTPRLPVANEPATVDSGAGVVKQVFAEEMLGFDIAAEVFHELFADCRHIPQLLSITQDVNNVACM